MIQNTFRKSIHRSCCIRVMMYPIIFIAFVLLIDHILFKLNIKRSFLQQLSITLSKICSLQDKPLLY